MNRGGWGLAVCFDHVLMKDHEMMPGTHGLRDLLCVYDVGTQLRYAIPVNSKNEGDTLNALRNVRGDGTKAETQIRVLFSDNWSALQKLDQQLCSTWRPSQPGHHNINAYAERNNQDIVYGVALC